jgi:hypothetical protein
MKHLIDLKDGEIALVFRKKGSLYATRIKGRYDGYKAVDSLYLKRDTMKS